MFVTPLKFKVFESNKEYQQMTINPQIFNILLRLLIDSARDKRLMEYHRVENIFGFSHKVLGIYSGKIGEFCIDNGWPLLNSLMVNKNTAQPHPEFLVWAEKQGIDCSASERECMAFFNVTTSREMQTKHFTGLNRITKEWVINLEQ